MLLPRYMNNYLNDPICLNNKMVAYKGFKFTEVRKYKIFIHKIKRTIHASWFQSYICLVSELIIKISELLFYFLVLSNNKGFFLFTL